MSTRATIKFTDEYGDSYFVYRGHDGFPDIILADINKAIEKCKGRFSRSEIGQLVAVFFGETYLENSRIQDYELTAGFHTDESYKYSVDYLNNEWVAALAN
tara:strand:- start:4707 stop:5009 length:303 start_codon:yes stop_codon:yes gene_type:complete